MCLEEYAVCGKARSGEHGGTEGRSGEHGGTEGEGLEYEKATAWEPQLVVEVWDEVAVRG